MLAPMLQEDGLACLQRVYEAADCRTQTELATFLGICQSTISDAKQRCTVPAEWMIKLFLKKRINPEWILTGRGTCQFSPSLFSTDELLREIVRRSL